MSTERSDLHRHPPSYDATQGYTYQSAPYQSQPQYGGQPGAHSNQTQQIVVSQPYGSGYVVTQARPPNYILPSILACLCCFWPTGLFAIYYASRANTLAEQGDMAEANRMAYRARNLLISSVVIGLCWIVLVIVLEVVVVSNNNTVTINYNNKH